MPETLYPCPHCGKAGFTARGLKSHITVQHTDRKGRPAKLEVMAPASTAPCLSGGNDKQVAEQLVELVRGAQDGVRRILMAGFFIEGIVRELPHGATRPWLEQHCPEVHWATVCRWRELARGVMESLGIEIDQVAKLPLPIHEMLALPPSDVPQPMQAMRGQIDDLIADKSARQLQLALRAADPKDGGDKQWAKWLKKHHPELIVNGAIPPRGKAPKEVRKAFDAYRIAHTKKVMKEIGPKAFTHEVISLAERIVEVCNNQILGQASEDAFNRLNEARLFMTEFMAGLAKGRASARVKGGKA